MQDRAEALEVAARKPAAECFNQGVTNRIRMAKAFALDDLDVVVIHGHGREE